MNKQNINRLIVTVYRLVVERRKVVGLDEKSEGIEKYRLVVAK